ncbi:MAG: hypothetical protein ABWY23_00760 [Mycetocola sp.]
MGTDDDRDQGQGTGGRSRSHAGKPGDDAEQKNFAVGIALGVSIGTALSVALDNWGFLGMGVAIGVAIGIALSQQKAAPSAGDELGRGVPGDGVPGGGASPRPDGGSTPNAEDPKP